MILSFVSFLNDDGGTAASFHATGDATAVRADLAYTVIADDAATVVTRYL